MVKSHAKNLPLPIFIISEQGNTQLVNLGQIKCVCQIIVLKFFLKKIFPTFFNGDYAPFSVPALILWSQFKQTIPCYIHLL